MTTTSTETAPPAEGPPATPDTGKDLASEVEKWKAMAQKHEARAKENATAAARLAALEQSQMSEAEKVAAQLAQAQTEAQAAKAEALRYKVATKFGVSDEDAETFLTGLDEETLIRQATRLQQLAQSQAEAEAQAQATAPAPRPDLSQGARQSTPLNGDQIEQSLKFALGIR